MYNPFKIKKRNNKKFSRKKIKKYSNENRK